MGDITRGEGADHRHLLRQLVSGTEVRAWQATSADCAKQ